MMSDNIILGLNILVNVLEILGATLLLIGFIIATIRCIIESLRVGGKQAVKSYRRGLARVILTGLELLVLATIIKTVTFDPSLENLEILIMMIVIRTIIGWTTALEMNNRWPWQRP
jgi:uncharacterized membrane protein